ncbi:MAG: FTR1 family protein [Candidatus Thorarchaeota archaeon]|nr:FTR1 family protein [Candidatus Thorarchaeota archaeon]
MMFVGPATIALREGIEAALIIAIMLSYLKQSNKMNLKRYVLGGTLVAVLVSVGFGTILGLIWGLFEGEALTIFEGAVVLVAAILLTTMIVWMWNAGSGIASEIEESMQERTGTRGAIGLALLAFALILREGVELVLFTIALAVQDAAQTYIGVTIGLSIAIVMGLGIYHGSLKISLKDFFNWTSVFLVLFAAGMIAYGIHELQEAGLLLIGAIEVWNINPPVLPDGSYPLFHDNGTIGGFAKALFGYNGNPSALEVAAYVSYLLIVSLYYMSRRNMKQEKRKSAAPAKEIGATA